MKNDIIISKLDYTRLNSMILNLLENKDTNLLELNRLNMEIKRALQVEPKKIKPEYITMNSIVEVLFSESGTSRTIRLSYPKDANFNEGKISVLSPLGCALLGYSQGETVSFRAPGGFQTVTIEKIIYQPESHGEDLC